jgi:small conductance mechanosensitive channel
VLRRTPANVNVKSRRRNWVTGAIAGVIALAALVAGSAFGEVHSSSLDPKLIAWISAAVILLAGGVATSRLSVSIGRLVAQGSIPAAGAAVRMLLAGVGYLVVAFSVLAVLDVSIEHLLVGAGLAGVVLGIAAQQSLGNVFAGLVLVTARPFSVGDHVRIRSGALGGIFDAWIEEMSLAYVTLRTDDGHLKIPNSAMLAAGIGQLPRTGPVPPLPTMPTPTAPTASSAPASPGATPAPAHGSGTDPAATAIGTVPTE